MKRALTLTLTALLGLPLLADEPKKPEPVQPETVKTADSPLVQAAKRSRASRAKKQGIVITNESLRGSKGHITTTKVAAAPIVPEPSPGPEAKLIAEKKRNEAAVKAQQAKRAEEKKAAEAKRMRAREAYAEEGEEGLYETLDGDPAAAEHAAEQATAQKPPIDR